LPQREVVDVVRKAWAAGEGGNIIPVMEICGEICAGQRPQGRRGE
jgi:hypothetical protein